MEIILQYPNIKLNQNPYFIPSLIMHFSLTNDFSLKD